jgi:predicted transcriptional regulator
MRTTIPSARSESPAARLGIDNPTRVRILRHLRLLPGDHFRSIVRTLDLGSGEARYHLGVLLRRGLVREERARGRCRYYLDGPDAEPERNALYMKHWEYTDRRGRLLLVLQRSGPATPTEVGRSLGISRQLAAYHLRHLEETGLVIRGGGRYRAAAAGPGGLDAGP